jgi:UDP-N-acetylmuramyl pentapeptide phosphotransferase/UDP-N-acetylglucosamine-1-phosphate transferase
MIAAGWALPVATLCLWLGDHCNRRWLGWLPDDPPRAGRKQHRRAMPLAGILLLPALAPWLLTTASAWLSVAVAVAAAVGFVDDRGKERGHDLGWRSKTIALLLASACGTAAVVTPATPPSVWLFGIVLVFVLTNATNFLDNTDGVASALAACSLGLLATAPNDAIAAGSYVAVAFVAWNWPRPRLFLGDSGAYALGLLTGVAALTTLQQDGRAWLAVAVQLGDFVQVIVARLWLGIAPWVGDRRHLTHIVQNLGVPRWLVMPLFAATALALGLGWRQMQ